MSNKIKGVILEDGRATLKYRTLMQDYHHLLKVFSFYLFFVGFDSIVLNLGDLRFYLIILCLMCNLLDMNLWNYILVLH